MAGVPRTTPLLPQLLADVEAYEKAEELSRETGAISYKLRWVYYPREGANPWGIRKECLIDGQEPNWPKVGLYECWVLDSAGEPILPEPFKGKHLSPEEMGVRGTDFNGPGDYLRHVMEEQRILIDRRSSDATQAERTANKAREEAARAQELLGNVQAELAKERRLREVAQANETVALEKQKAAEQAMEELREELDEWKPQLEIAADRFFGHVKSFFGFPGEGEGSGDQAPLPRGPGLPPAPSGDAAPAAGTTGEERPAAWDDPKEAEQAAHTAMADLYDAVLYNLDVLKEMVDRGVLPWPLVRDLIFFKSGHDIGREPRWAEWFAAREAAQKEEG